MVIEYRPNRGFSINSTEFDWGEARESIREKLKFLHEEDDQTIELAQFFDGDESQNIQQKSGTPSPPQIINLKKGAALLNWEGSCFLTPTHHS